jgi:hypothetical protein
MNRVDGEEQRGDPGQSAIASEPQWEAQGQHGSQSMHQHAGEMPTRGIQAEGDEIQSKPHQHQRTVIPGGRLYVLPEVAGEVIREVPPRLHRDAMNMMARSSNANVNPKLRAYTRNAASAVLISGKY